VDTQDSSELPWLATLLPRGQHVPEDEGSFEFRTFPDFVLGVFFLWLSLICIPCYNETAIINLKRRISWCMIAILKYEIKKLSYLEKKQIIYKYRKTNICISVHIHVYGMYIWKNILLYDSTRKQQLFWGKV
jgi:hypothetical protein